jgi:2-dehydro-3-deoxyphosphogluconate aldolase/(4S)-4-hydroxy-2-oxoglutarate aldolase
MLFEGQRNISDDQFPRWNEVRVLSKEDVMERILDTGLIVVIRLHENDRLNEVVEALGSAGARVIEITTTVPGAIESISRYSRDLGDEFTFGLGTITDGNTAIRAIEAGAEFVVSPVFQEEMLKTAKSRGVLAIPAAYGPTEIWRANEMGADAVKLFPARSLGPAFVRDILGPLPGIKIIPAGGVDAKNAGSYISAGAAAVFSGSSIVSDRKLMDGGTEDIRASTREMIDSIRQARREIK